jgi:glycosyltransferase involved in cell wall biosynthesis
VKYGPSDVIQHGVNGILVPDGDTAAMAEEVTRLLTDRALREPMSRAARSSGDSMGADVAIARWSALFNRLAQAWSAG